MPEYVSASDLVARFDERDIQDKVKKQKAAKAKRTRTEKEW